MSRVGYVHLARFSVQKLLRETPSLAGQPVVLVEESHGVRKVTCASTAALRAGVRVGMTLTAACALQPSLNWFFDDTAAEKAALLSLGEALMALAVGFQLSMPDGLWLDASAAHLSGGEALWGQEVLQLCEAHGYRGQVAIASSLFTARALARYGSHRVEVVEEALEAETLSELPLQALEIQRVQTLFSTLGVSTLGEVAALPVGAVVARLGMDGLRALRCCRGEDDTPMVPEKPSEMMLESIGLDWPAESMEPLLFALKTVLSRLGARLSGRGLAAVRLAITLGLDPRGDVRFELVLARPSSDAKLLLELARHRLSNVTLPNPVSSVCALVEESCPHRERQLGLGEEPLGDAALEVVLSRLSTTMGAAALFSADMQDSHRPESAYGTSAFRPPPREHARALQEASGGLFRPIRLLSSPEALSARVGPSGALETASVFGKEYRVVAQWGPERLAGEWWASTAFERDYYRVHLDGLGPVWLFRDLRDGRFYLQGLFD